MTIASKLKRASPTILGIFASAGVFGTAFLSVKATPKAMQLLEKAKTDKGEELTKWEIVRTAAPSYLPAAALALSTVLCIFGANVLNRKQQAALISAYTMADRALREFKKKATELYGENAEQEIETAIAKEKFEEGEYETPSKDKRLFFEEHIGRYIERTMEEIIDAEYHFNRYFIMNGYATLNNLLDYFGVDPIEGGDAIGWSVEAGFTFYGYSWVDFEHVLIKMDDGLECYIINLPYPPTADFLAFR